MNTFTKTFLMLLLAVTLTACGAEESSDTDNNTDPVVENPTGDDTDVDTPVDDDVTPEYRDTDDTGPTDTPSDDDIPEDDTTTPVTSEMDPETKERIMSTAVDVVCATQDIALDYQEKATADPDNANALMAEMQTAMQEKAEEIVVENGFADLMEFESTAAQFDADAAESAAMEAELMQRAKDQCGFDLTPAVDPAGGEEITPAASEEDAGDEVSEERGETFSDASTGIPECDAYLEKMNACVETSEMIPEESKQAYRESMAQSQEVWSSAAAAAMDDEQKQALIDACTQADTAMADAAPAMGCEW